MISRAKGDPSVAAAAQRSAVGPPEICLLVILAKSCRGILSKNIFAVTARPLNEIITVVLWACVHLAFLGETLVFTVVGICSV